MSGDFSNVHVNSRFYEHTYTPRTIYLESLAVLPFCDQYCFPCTAFSLNHLCFVSFSEINRCNWHHKNNIYFTLILKGEFQQCSENEVVKKSSLPEKNECSICLQYFN